jgi:hypothetical protein
MPSVRAIGGKLLAAALLTICLGAMTLEATGRWDATFQDAGDEAALVAVALCVGAAIVVAAAARHHVSFSPQSPIIVRATRLTRFVPPAAVPAFDTSPPALLRI